MPRLSLSPVRFAWLNRLLCASTRRMGGLVVHSGLAQSSRDARRGDAYPTNGLSKIFAKVIVRLTTTSKLKIRALVPFEGALSTYRGDSSPRQGIYARLWGTLAPVRGTPAPVRGFTHAYGRL